MPQPLQLTHNSSSAVLICCQKHTLLHTDPGSVLLKVEQVLRVLGQRSYHNAEVRVLVVRHDIKALQPHGVLLIPNWEKCGR
jgi:hypothetical protein